MQNLKLGQSVEYPASYDATLLQAVPRQMSRTHIGINHDKLPFTGIDTWNAYEVSWLNDKYKPQVAILECQVPIESPNLIESKSFKLYLNSLNQSRFNNQCELLQVLNNDLSACAGSPVKLCLIPSHEFAAQRIGKLSGILIDEIDTEFDPHATILKSALVTGNEIVEEVLVSHLLKSNCLITHQPDWGSLLIKYKGCKIDREGLLKYIVSFRLHNEFHEQCVERIFVDIMQRCQPEKLTVYARYTRRGGLDINPFRSNFESNYANIRLARQ